MRNIAQTSALAAILAVAVLFPACGGEDEATVQDGGRDGAADASRLDVSAEAAAAEAGSETTAEASAEAGTGVTTGPEAGVDARAADAGTDARLADATAEAAVDAQPDTAAPDAVASDAGALDATIGRDAEAGTVARDAEAGAIEAATTEAAAALDAEAGAVDARLDAQGDAALLDGAGDATVASTVVVNEINTEGVDFVELFNTGSVAVDVSGWTLSDNQPTANGRPYTIAGGTSIAPGAFLTVYGTADGGLGYGLGDPDSVILRDAQGRLVATHLWTTARETDSRCPNGSGAFSNGRAATPGATNDCSQ